MCVDLRNPSSVLYVWAWLLMAVNPGSHPIGYSQDGNGQSGSRNGVQSCEAVSFIVNLNLQKSENEWDARQLLERFVPVVSTQGFGVNPYTDWAARYAGGSMHGPGFGGSRAVRVANPFPQNERVASGVNKNNANA